MILKLFDLGKRFASPIKEGPRKKRCEKRGVLSLASCADSDTETPSVNPPDVPPVTPPPCLVATTGQQLLDDIVVKELPCISTDRPDNSHTDPVLF